MGQDIRRGLLGGIEANPSPKYYAVMLFYRASEIGIPLEENQEDFWINTSTQFFNDGTLAFKVYANTPCPASQILKAGSPEELAEQIKQMKKNYHDLQWLETNLYPYL